MGRRTRPEAMRGRATCARSSRARARAREDTPVDDTPVDDTSVEGTPVESARSPCSPARALAIAIAIGWACATSGAATATAVAARSGYAVRPACSAPAPGRAACFALGLEPRTAAARARVHFRATRTSPDTGLVKAGECSEHYPSSCLAPEDLRSAYFPGEKPEAPASAPQTIALVDAYNDLNAEADLGVYAGEFGLPPCTKANGCFKQVGENGGEASSELPFPKSKAELEAFAKGTAGQRRQAEEAEGWALETDTDIEVAHAVCRNCKIVLVESGSPEYLQLDTAENTAVALHAGEISDSWGGPESGVDETAFEHPGIAITAAAGDAGYLNRVYYATREQPGSPYFEGPSYPASSPHVISVGGTHLTLDAKGAWHSESAWNEGGGGCSDSLPAPAWQRAVPDWGQVGCAESRASTDVSADADPATGVNVYDSTPYPYEEEGRKLSTVLHWAPIGGTSVASPIIASMVALAGGAQGVAYPAKTLYAHLGSSLLHDVTSGGNGECEGVYTSCSGSMNPLSPLDCGAGTWICNATVGYDGPTGVGTPNGVGAFEPEAGTSGGGGGGEEGGGQASKVGGENGGAGGTPGGGGESAVSGASAGSGGAAGAQVTSGRLPTGSASGSAARAVRITALALTLNARTALRHGRIAVGQIAFSFALTRACTVRVTLARRVGVGGDAHWQTLSVRLRLAVSAGVNRRRLHGAGELPPGVYRLTLAPAGGVARSLTIRVARAIPARAPRRVG
jgi:hypothetical protein